MYVYRCSHTSPHVCMRVCMYACIYVCMYTDVLPRLHMCVCVYVFMHVCKYVCIQMFPHVSTVSHPCLYVTMHACMCMCMCVYMYPYLVCMPVYVYVWAIMPTCPLTADTYGKISEDFVRFIWMVATSASTNFRPSQLRVSFLPQILWLRCWMSLLFSADFSFRVCVCS